MIMENMAAAKPQKSFLELPCRAKSDTKATAENNESTKVKRPRILAFSFLGANTMKISTYIVSINAPVPFTVDTKMLWGDTKGRPYLRIVKIIRDYIQIKTSTRNYLCFRIDFCFLVFFFFTIIFGTNYPMLEYKDIELK